MLRGKSRALLRCHARVHARGEETRGQHKTKAEITIDILCRVIATCGNVDRSWLCVIGEFINANVRPNLHWLVSLVGHPTQPDPTQPNPTQPPWHARVSRANSSLEPSNKHCCSAARYGALHSESRVQRPIPVHTIYTCTRASERASEYCCRCFLAPRTTCLVPYSRDCSVTCSNGKLYTYI